MCDPVLGAQAAGAAINTVGSYFSAASQKSALKSQARIAEINAKLADAAARAELLASEQQQEAIKLRGSQVEASQRAGYAGSGIDVSVGTPIDVAVSTKLVTEVDANRAAAAGIQAAWGRRIEAGNLRRGATSMRATAKGISPGFAALSTLLGSAGPVAKSWYELDKVGAIGRGTTPDAPASSLSESSWSKFGADLPEVRSW